MHCLFISGLKSLGLAGILAGLLWSTWVCGISSSGDLCSPLRSSQGLTELRGGLEDKAALGFTDPACVVVPQLCHLPASSASLCSHAQRIKHWNVSSLFPSASALP